MSDFKNLFRLFYCKILKSEVIPISEIRKHYKIDNKVVSIYINENLTVSQRKFYASDGMLCFKSNWCDYIGACISTLRRKNNDWWNGRKSGNTFYNKMTGKGHYKYFNTIVNYMVERVLYHIKNYEIYYCEIGGTNKKRLDTYFLAITHMCKKYNLRYEYYHNDYDNYYFIIIQGGNL